MNIVPRQEQSIASIADLQAANDQFWAPIRARFAEQMLDLNFAERVMGHYSWTRLRDNDFKNEKPLEFHALSVAESFEAEGTAVRKELARKGGQAQRKSPLNDLIKRELANHGAINAPQLLERLRQDDSGVVEVDSVDIHCFEDNGRRKSVPISGLSDRLDRIKKRLFAATGSRG